MNKPQVFKPRPYQHTIIDHILSNERCGVWAGMGTGKTSSTLTALDILELIDPSPALVIAPLRVASSTWPDEAKKWEHLQHTTVVAIVGSREQREAALRTPANIYTINYENLPWLIGHLGDNWPFTKIVADESTKLKSFRLRQGGKRAQALGKVAFDKVKYFIELTGTPSPNGLQDLWGQMWFIDRGARLGKNFKAFTTRWFQSEPVGMGKFAVRLIPFNHSQVEIQNKLKDICISIDARDHFDIAEPIMHVVNIELPPAARKLYKAMEAEMFIELSNGAEIEAFNAASKTIKCLQLANGAAYTDDKGAFAPVHDVKIDALESIVNEAAGMPVLVAYHFKSDLERLLKAFPAGRQLDKNPQTITDWNAGKIPVLFAHPASAGHGLNLQDGGNILVFFGHWWNLEEYQQIIERIGPTRQAQAGHDRPMFIYQIVAKDTVDEIIMVRRESKRSVQDLLLEAMKNKEAA